MIIIRGNNVKVRIEMTPLKKYVKAITEAGQPYYDRLIQEWVEIYKQFIRTRFNTRGHGSWLPLKRKTKKRVAKRSRRVLIDSKTLLNVWRPKSVSTGYYERKTRKGVRLGYGGGARHPFARNLTIMGLAIVHQKGLGRVPKREIVVDADKKTEDRMERAVKRIAIRAKRHLGMK